MDWIRKYKNVSYSSLSWNWSLDWVCALFFFYDSNPMSTLQSATADILCVLASCGRQLTGEHQSSTETQHIVWTQAHGALVSKVGEGGCAYCHSCKPDLQELNTREAGVNMCPMHERNKDTLKGRKVFACGGENEFIPALICVCVCVFEGVLVYLAGSLSEGGWRACKEEVCILRSLSEKRTPCGFWKYEEIPNLWKKKRAKAKTVPKQNTVEVTVPSLYHRSRENIF